MLGLYQIILAVSLLASRTYDGNVLVRSLQSGAKVYVDYEYQGKTPLLLKKLTIGKHHVAVKQMGYLDSEQDFEIVAQKTTIVEFDLLPYAGILDTQSTIKNTELYIDGQFVAKLPYQGEIPIGKRIIEVKKEGYVTLRQTIQIGAGNRYQISANLLQLSKTENELSEIPLVPVSVPKMKSLQVKQIENNAKKKIVMPQFDHNKTVKYHPSAIHKEKWKKSWYQEWWFWTSVSVVVSAAVVIPVVVTQMPQSQQAPAFSWQLN